MLQEDGAQDDVFLVPGERDPATGQVGGFLLSGRGDKDFLPYSPSFVAGEDVAFVDPSTEATITSLTEAFSAFHAVQLESGLSGVELVCRWALSVKSVDKWVIGASKPAQIEDTMSILRRGPLPTDLQSALDGLEIPSLDWSELWK